MRKRTIVLLVAGLAALFLLLSALAPLIMPSERRKMVLPDGHELQLLDITFGTGHSFSGEKGRGLFEYLTQEIRRLRGVPVNMSVIPGIGEPTIALWFEPPSSSKFFPELYLFTADDGTELLAEPRTTFFGNAMVHEFTSFPRGAKRFEVTPLFKQRGGGYSKSPSFQVQNDLRNSAPSSWAPVTLPAVSRDRDTLFTLLGLETSKFDPSSTEELRSSFSYKVEQAGDPSAEWSAVPVRIADESGNTASSFSWSVLRDRVKFSNGVSPAEPWRLEIEYYKTTNFLETEIALVHDIAVPAKNAEEEMNREIATNGGHKVTLNAFGNGKYRFGKATHTDHGQALLFAKPAEFDFRVTVIDEEATEVKARRSESASEVLYQFELKPDAKRIHLQISIVPKYRASFIAQPRIVSVTPK